MAEKLKILVIDDKRVIGDLFEFTLGYGGHDITFTDNAQTALDAIKTKDFDIAFIDIVMPCIDGVETFKAVKSLAPNLPVVMMSGYSVEDKRNEAKELGAATSLKKPFEMEDVKNIIKDVLGKEI